MRDMDVELMALLPECIRKELEYEENKVYLESLWADKEAYQGDDCWDNLYPVNNSHHTYPELEKAFYRDCYKGKDSADNWNDFDWIILKYKMSIH